MPSSFLPSIAREISLFNKHCDDRGIYRLQRVRIDINDFVIFVMIMDAVTLLSQNNAVKMLGSRATQISSQPVTISGVGNS